jgi:hypothetical protein
MGQIRRIRTGALATAVVLAGVLTAGTGNSRAADGSSVPMQFAAVTVQSIRLNVGPPAPSTGDRLVFSHTLTKDKKTAGLAGVECVMTSVTTSKPAGKQKPVTSVRSNCVATIVLTDGQIAAQGLTDLVDNTGSFELAVTGGTGAYAGAAGVMRKAGGKDKGTYIIDITRG